MTRVAEPTETVPVTPAAAVGGDAWVFPGQGAQGPTMLQGIRGLPEFAEHFALICELTQTDIDAELARDGGALLRENRFSSLLTILVSVVSLAEYRREGGAEPRCVAGYSVGQWTALYAAGVLDFPTLARTVLERARFMDACVAREASGMYAVLGLPLEPVEQALCALRAEGHRVFVSNCNCIGNYSIGGTLDALALARERLEQLGAKRLSPVPVSGAWHCPILDEAADRFFGYLADVPLAAAAVPVMDNVTGQWLPVEHHVRRQQLAEHLRAPVLWDRLMRNCMAVCDRVVEIGYGNSLTKLGFFIDRRKAFESYDLSHTAGRRVCEDAVR